MKKYIFIILSFVTLFAITPKEAYKKALEYEKKGDTKNALYWYKKAASISLGIGKKEQNELKVKKADDNILKTLLSPKIAIEPYRTNYILPVTYDSVEHEGRKSIETKFQISIKKELFRNLLGLKESIYFGYTQTSYWQITQKSAPFRETNYEPELFVVFPYQDNNSSLKYYRVGIVHQSNGRGVPLSRSWNRIYLQGAFEFGDLVAIPRVWYRIPEKKKSYPLDPDGDDNPDIWNYMGYGDLKLIYPYKKHRFSLLLRNNFRRPNRGAAEFEWTFPLLKDGIFGYMQIFSGYGESLIDYNKRNNKIGLGFAITR